MTSSRSTSEAEVWSVVLMGPVSAHSHDLRERCYLTWHHGRHKPLALCLKLATYGSCNSGHPME